MAKRDILIYPNNETELRSKSKPVEAINRRTKRLIQDLKDTLGAYSNGAGLAAPQINVHLRVVIVQLGSSKQSNDAHREFTTLVNPIILDAGKERRDFDGCLSFPSLFGETVRPHYLRVSGLDDQGEPFERVFKGFDAVVVHHEIDHLNGVLFIDHIKDPEKLWRTPESETTDKAVEAAVPPTG